MNQPRRPNTAVRPGVTRPRSLVTAPPHTWVDDLEDVALELAPYVLSFGLILGAIAVGLLLIWVQPAWLTSTWATLSGIAPKAYWYLSRASALVGFVLLWVSMALGLVLSNRWARLWPGGPTFNALHEHTSLLGLAFGVFHALILRADPYLKYSFTQLLLPFGSLNYRPGWVGLGQIALYVLIPVTLTFYVRRWIGVRAWRLIHGLSFGVFALVLLHGLLSGTDSQNLLVLELYWVSAVSTASLTVYRLLTLRAPQRQTAA